MQVIADATFYLVFLLDISKPDYLGSILDAQKFFLPPLVDKEIQIKLKKEGNPLNYTYIDRRLKNNQIKKLDNSEFDLGLILKYFTGKTNPKIGEDEVVAYSFYLIKKYPYLCIVLDDGDARERVKTKKKLHHVYSQLKWSTDVIVDCYCNFNILKRQDCIQIIYEMKKVNALKIPDRMYDEILDRVKSFQNLK